MAQVKPPLRLIRPDGSELVARIVVADSLWSRFMGLMGKRELPAGEGICIRPCSSIHMFFMRFPIDAVFVDADGLVLRIYGSIRPWRVSGIVWKAKACVELAAGTAAAKGLHAGDRVELVDA